MTPPSPHSITIGTGERNRISVAVRSGALQPSIGPSAVCDQSRSAISAPHIPPLYRLSRKPGAEFPQFVDLFRNPTDYHGKLVTLTGHVRKLVEMPADQNPYGIERLYEVWFFDQHSQSNPSVVICTSLDPRLKPEPETLIDHCRVTGYFFKNMAYDGQRDLRFAPLLIGQKLEYFPPAPSELGPSSATPDETGHTAAPHMANSRTP